MRGWYIAGNSTYILIGYIRHSKIPFTTFLFLNHSCSLRSEPNFLPSITTVNLFSYPSARYRYLSNHKTKEPKINQYPIRESKTEDMSNVKRVRSHFPASFHREAAECRTSSPHTVPRTTDAAPVSFVVGELPPGWKCDALDCYRRRASGVTLPHQEEY